MFVKGQINFNVSCTDSQSYIVQTKSKKSKFKGKPIPAPPKVPSPSKPSKATKPSPPPPPPKASSKAPTKATPKDVESQPKKKSKKKKGEPTAPIVEEEDPKRVTWSNPFEFLLTCLATAIGLGNVWRFPMVAYKNGGGAFLVPYIVTLIIVGRPLYFLENFIGQFSSANCVQLWDMVPPFRGSGLAQVLGCGYVLSYYMSITATCMFYLFKSFYDPLPWSYCEEEWSYCVASGEMVTRMGNRTRSSAELFFKKTVLQQEYEGIDRGIGTPVISLTISLLMSWFFVFITTLVEGMKFTGKALYFLVLGPYFTLLIRSVTLPGAQNGIVFFLKPRWTKVLEPKVWYAAVTQLFFSLSICSGVVPMFASFNNFRANVYRDTYVVTSLDTLTSLLSGISIFAILGNLAHQLGHDSIENVVSSGEAGLAFISYPNAMAKTPFAPRFFSVVFYLMMSVLGVGTGVSLFSSIVGAVGGAIPRISTFYITVFGSLVGFCSGLPYVTPGGQYILSLVDYYGGTFTFVFAGMVEEIGIFWIYGLENVCLDVEYTLGRKLGVYWRFTWGLIIPVLMITVTIYSMMTTEFYKYGGFYVYPDSAYIAGYFLQYSAPVIFFGTMFVKLYKHRSGNFAETLKEAFKISPRYGPVKRKDFKGWKKFRKEAKSEQDARRKNWFQHILLSLIGGYRQKVIDVQNRT